MNDTKRKNIAVLMSASDDDYEIRFVRGIRDCAQMHNANVCVFMSFGGYDIETGHNIGEYNIYNLPDLTQYDGIILVPNLISALDIRRDILIRIQESGIPYVMIDYRSPDFYHESYGIYTNNSLPIYQIVEHLITVHGMQKINFVTGPPENTESNERFQGYCDALQKYNIPYEENRIFHGSFIGDSGVEAVHTFIHQDKEGISAFPEAIVFGNDAMALHGASELIRLGYRIPEDVAVTGYDDINRARDFSPRLTTISRPIETISYHACERILQMAEGLPVGPTDTYSAYPVFRESCGCHSYHEPEDYSQFRLRQFQENLTATKNATTIPSMSRDLYECNDFQEYYHKLATYATQIDCEEFYLCLDPEFENALSLDEAFMTSGYVDTMTVPLALYQGHPIHYPDFKTRETFPKLSQKSEKPGFYFFLPVHYREFGFGYVVLQNTLEPFTNTSFRAWMMVLSSSLENIRKQKLLKSMIAELDSKYIQDSLTGLYNRFGFTRHAREAFYRSSLTHKSLAILFFDMDSLKYINDVFGHDEGDFAIVHFARTLTQFFSEDIICRFGGDEFVVLSELVSPELLRQKLRRLYAELRRISEKHAKPYTIQTSAGFYIRKPDDTSSIEDCVIRADKKMYVQKRRKRQG